MALSTLYTVSEVAERLRCSERTVWDWVRTGELPSFKLGRRRVVPESSVEAFIAAKLDAAR